MTWEAQVLEAAVCTQCGAGVTVPQQVEHFPCPYCHTTLFVFQGRIVEAPRRGSMGRALAIPALAGLVLLGAVSAVWQTQVVSVVTHPAAEPVRGGHVGGSAWEVQIPSNPSYLDNPELLRGLPGRILDAADGSRFQYLSVGADGIVVGIVEVGPAAIDSVLFSFGHTIIEPISQNEDALARLEKSLYTLTGDQLAVVPVWIDQVLEEQPAGTKVDRLTVHAHYGEPMAELAVVHPLRELKPVQRALASF